MSRAERNFYKPGMKVLVRGGFGTEKPVVAIITEVHSDIKNGRPGVDYREVKSGEERWAYLYQIDALL